MILCKFGCGQEGKFKLKNNEMVCSDHHTKCPAQKRKNSEAGKRAWLNKPTDQRNTTKGVSPWNKGLTKETDARVKKYSESVKKTVDKNGVWMTGKTHSIETKLKIAKAMKGNTYGLGWGKITYYKNIKMRSRWKAQVAKYLDKNNINWIYEEKNYILDDETSYRPDFFIYDDNKNFLKIIEVKGYFREENKEKFKKFLKKYSHIKIELWEYDTLRKLNLIKTDGTIMGV